MLTEAARLSLLDEEAFLMQECCFEGESHGSIGIEALRCLGHVIYIRASHMLHILVLLGETWQRGN